MQAQDRACGEERRLHQCFRFGSASNAVAAVLFCSIQGFVRPGDGRKWIHLSRRDGRDAEAGRDAQLFVVPRNRVRFDFPAERFRDALGALGRRIREENQEFLASVAALQVASTEHGVHPAADGAEDGVSRKVAIPIVDTLEVVKVEDDTP